MTEKAVIERALEALAFAACTIKSGEAWSDTCKKMIYGARDALIPLLGCKECGGIITYGRVGDPSGWCDSHGPLCTREVPSD